MPRSRCAAPQKSTQFAARTDPKMVASGLIVPMVTPRIRAALKSVQLAAPAK
ncbi:MAG: hypothetical protein U0939_17700 [Pirellulales bacterium]